MLKLLKNIFSVRGKVSRTQVTAVTGGIVAVLALLGFTDMAVDPEIVEKGLYILVVASQYFLRAAIK